MQTGKSIYASSLCQSRTSTLGQKESPKMAIKVVPLQEADISGVVECIQEGFADDPYFQWVFDASKVCIRIYDFAFAYLIFYYGKKKI